MKKILSILFTLCIASSFAKYSIGTISTSNEWTFVAKFAFGNYGTDQGNLTWGLTSDPANNLILAVYDDEATSWDRVYKSQDMNCMQKINSSKIWFYVNDNGTQSTLFVDDYYSPHYWYVVVAKCGAQSSYSFEYNLHFTNPAGSGWGDVELSYDEHGMPALFFSFWLFSIFLVVFVVFVMLKIWRQENEFSLINRLVASMLALEWFYLFFGFCHWASYANNGKGAPGLLAFAELLNMAAVVILMLMLVLVARGWYVKSREIDLLKITLAGVAVVSIFYLVLFIWGLAGRDPASTYYVYESAPGVLVLLVRAGVWIWFGWSIRGSSLEENEPGRKRFYYFFGGAFSLWFFTLIFWVLICLGLPDYSRYKTMQGLTVTFDWFAFLGFTLLALIVLPHYESNSSYATTTSYKGGYSSLPSGSGTGSYQANETTTSTKTGYDSL